jgi:hypothetical protein
MTVTEILIIGASFGSIWGSHWFPWHQIPLWRPYGGLPPAVSHLVGVSWIWLWFVVWLAVQNQAGEPLTAQGVAVFLTLDIAAAGAGAILPRIIKKVLRGMVADEEMRAALDELEKEKAHAARQTKQR